jgi:hypothetical protein
MPDWAVVAKYLNCSMTLRKGMKGFPPPRVPNYTGEAHQALEMAALAGPMGVCANMYTVVNLAHRSPRPVRRIRLVIGGGVPRRQAYLTPPTGLPVRRAML